MPADYVPILILVVFAVGMSAIAIVLSALLGPRKSTPTKLAPYESGMVPFGDARLRFSIKFYAVAILFILFDVEAIFLYPWAVMYGKLSPLGKLLGLAEVVAFLAILFVGYFYAWRKGALEWD
ncbi:MAG TPA: NADH-quinone oxidoreductase subunit A [Anaerolineae bacterium]|nr:NADH-quinone oxidoreductase subunit A [Anaerolineae bacterium]HPL30919.1 NADH-quinone oxidoreductase subunit A [Anaerolineae bacterium]